MLLLLVSLVAVVGEAGEDTIGGGFVGIFIGVDVAFGIELEDEIPDGTAATEHDNDIDATPEPEV